MRLAYAAVLLSLACGYDFSNELVSPLCPPSLVGQLSTLGLVEYVLRNCAHSPTGSKRTLGNRPDPGDQVCLAHFILAHNLTSADALFPEYGACRESIQNLVTGIYTKATQQFELMSADSTVLNITDAAFFQDGSNGIGDPLAVFQLENRYSVAYPGCSAQAVRTWAMNGTYDVMVGWIGNDPSATYWYSAPESLSDSLCESCYELFSMALGEGFQGDAGVAGICKLNPQDEKCKSSTVVQQARSFFKRCAGYEIDYMDDVCTAGQLDAIFGSISPSPFYSFMFCALAGSEICVFIQSYLDQLTKAGSAECTGCFIDFYQSIDVAAAREFCSTDDLFAPACIASQQLALFQFQICAGRSMNIS